MYALIRQILFLRSPERVHESAVALLESLGASLAGRALLRTIAGTYPRLPLRAMGLAFEHPLGMAAGFDKDARAILGLQELGFSHVEIGTVTPRPQPGNPKPRIWRFSGSRAIVNALGFPGEGMRAVRARIEETRRSGHVRVPIGANLGKNADTAPEQAAEDYVAVLNELYEVADYFVINVSSPNTVGLRDLQAVAALRPILDKVMNRATQRGGKPVMLKVSPDLADHDLIDIARLARQLGLAGIIAANTTIRRGLVPAAKTLDRGGLSGAPLWPRTLEMVKLLRPELAPEQVLVASGGVSTSQRLQQVLQDGASLVQIYTPFIYLGPQAVRKLLRFLAANH